MGITLDNIDFAAIKTLETHPNFNMEDNFFGYILDGFDPSFFTSNDNARKLISTIPKREFIYEIGLFSMECGKLYEEIINNCPEYESFIAKGIDTYNFYINTINKKIDPYAYLLTHKNVLASLAGIFGYYRYHHFSEYKSLIKTYNISVDSIYEESYDKFRNIKNVRVRNGNVNKCLDDLSESKHLQLSQAEYSLDGKMFTFSDKGRVRDKQEDSALIMRHPDNANYRLIGVADGMGGLAHGGEVSSMALNLLASWFEDLDVADLDNPEDLNPLGCAIISKINDSVFKKYHGKAGCTLSFAIVANGITMVFNIGDSRCYVLNDGNIAQVTKDDSYVYGLYSRGILLEKDDIRFHPRRNEITKSIGMAPSIYTTNVRVLRDYDLLLFFTDGVTDALSDSDIKLYASSLRPDIISKEIVKCAKFKKDKKEIIMEDGNKHTYEIEGGSDNLTGAVFNKRG